MKNLSLTILLTLCAVFCTARAGDTTDAFKMIAKKWKIANFESAEGLPKDKKSKMDKALKNAYFDFHADSSCTMLFGETNRSGRWYLDGNTLVLVDEGGGEERDSILQLTDTKLVLLSREGARITMTDKPQKGGTGTAGRYTPEMVARKWDITAFEVEGMSAEQRKALADHLHGASFEFRTDGTTTMSVGDMRKTGTWEVDGENLILTDEKGARETSRILVLTKTMFQIRNNAADGKNVTVKMKIGN